MKAFINKLFLLGIIALLVSSCEKEETKAVLNAGAAPTLAVSATSVALTQAAADSAAVTFSWNEVDYGFNDAIQYTLQISKAGTGFAAASTAQVGVTKPGLQKSFTVAELNAALNSAGFTAGVAQEVEARLVANTSNIVSNVIKMTVTPYKVQILYTFPQAINVAGNYQGWTPGTAPQIVATGTPGEYLGFIDFSAGTPAPEFKLVKGNDWPAGDYGSPSAGVLSNGGNNLTLPSAGIYKIEVNTNAMTWSFYKINSWGLIGNAVPTTGWDADRDMAFDPISKTYTITLDLVPGDIKFRANDDWTLNLGDNGADGRPDIAGSNIAIAAAGNYTITLDILTGGNLSYTIKKN
jgi:starch-binding outer membrane protein SusE/F